MVSQEIIRILIKAEDYASQAAEKAANAMKNLGNTSTTSMSKATQSAQNYTNKINESTSKFSQLSQSVNRIGLNGATSFNQLTNAQQKALLEFSSLDNKSRELVQSVDRVGTNGMNSFLQLSNSQQRALTSMDSLSQSATRTSGSFSQFGMNATAVQEKLSGMSLAPGLNPSIESAKVQVSSMGYSLDSTSGKLLVLGERAKTSIGEAFTSSVQSAKEKLSSLGSSITGTSSRMSGLNTGSRIAGGGLGFLRNAASMTVGMIGYDLVNSIAQSARTSINAAGNFNAFGKRLGMTGSEINSFRGKVNELQGSFRKVDMNAVGAAALELGVKLKIPKDSMDELTKTTAVMSSAFVKEGRTQEDAILAVSDAMDGQFRRLQELGITQDMLKNNGWDGDLQNKTSLLQAMNKTLDQMGFTTTAMQINTLDEAYQALSVSGGQLLGSVLIPLTPAFVSITYAVIGAVDGVKKFIGSMQKAWAGLPDWAQLTIILTGVGIAFGLLAVVIWTTVIPAIVGSIVGFINMILPMLGVEVSAITLTGAFSLLAGAVWGALAPLLPFIAAAVLAGVAIYEVGKYLGWWKDFGTMFKAITAGVKRLWAAFINHPDVKAFIKSIGDAWKWLNDTLKPVISWLQSIWVQICPPSAKGKVDAVRAIIEGLGFAWKVLKVAMEVATFPMRMIAQVLIALWNVAQPVGQGIYSALKPIICILLGCSPGIVPALKSTYEWFTTVWNAIAGFIGGVVSGIVSTLGSIVSTLGNLINYVLSGQASLDMLNFVFSGLYNIMNIIGSFLPSVFQPAWQLMMDIFLVIWNSVIQLVTIFSELMNGQISLSEAIVMVWNLIWSTLSTILSMIISAVWGWASQMWNSAMSAASGFVNNVIIFISTLPSKIWAWLLSVINRVVSWAGSMYAHARNTGSRFVTGVISFISSLPGRIWSYLSNTIGKAVSWASSMISHARSAGSGMVTGLISYLSQLPGKAYTEFINMKNRILSAGAQIIAQAKHIGSDIVKAMLNAMGIHSPGTIQLSVGAEMINTLTKIKDVVKPAGDIAKKLGENIVKKFGTPKLQTDVTDVVPETTMPNEDTNVASNVVNDVAPNPVNVPVTTDTSNLQTGLNSTTELTNTTNQGIATSYQELLANMSMSMDQMVQTDQLAYGQIQMNDSTAMNNVKNNLSTNLMSMKNNLSSNLNNMVLKNTSSMNNIRLTTNNQLTSMLSSTKAVTNNMVSAWQTMATKIISSANNIKTQSTNYFDQLSNTIGKFYRKLQNPGSWGAGAGGGSPSHIHPASSPSGGFLSRIGNALRRKQAPTIISLSQAKASPCVDQSCLTYMKTDGSSNLNMADLVRGNCITCGVDLTDIPGGAGWDDAAPKNVSYIKKIAREWGMKGPVIANKYPTGASFKVKEFENGTPNISYDTFKGMAEDVFSNIQYDFYWDSTKYGNWLNAFYAGHMNCSDSSDAIIGLAHACNLSASKVHGHWNSLGHFWAEVEGHKMDTTGWMQHRNWTPAQSHAGPAPFDPFNEQNQLLNQLVHNSNETPEFNNTKSESVDKVEGELTIKHEVDLKNIPEGMDEETILEIFKDVSKNDNWIKQLVNNPVFQDWDMKIKDRIERKNNRNGVGV